MAGPSKSFRRRFPTHSARVDRRPDETRRAPALSKGERIAAILHAALPLLTEHADHEPFAVPVVEPRRIKAGRHVAGWVAGSFQIGGPKRGNQRGTRNYLLLTEGGKVGIGYNKDDHGAHLSGTLTGIDELDERYLGTINEAEVYGNLRRILRNAGVEFEMVNIENPTDIPRVHAMGAAPDAPTGGPPRPIELSASEEIRTSRGVIR